MNIKSLLIFTTIIYLLLKNVSYAALNPPNGKYYVGFKNYHLINVNACPNRFYTNRNNNDFSGSNLKKCNEIWLRIYYPTYTRGFSAYFPASALIDDVKSISPSINKADINNLSIIKSFSLNNAPAAKGKFPVILFSPGYGIAGEFYENIITNLVSNGYIVVAINSQFINGKLTLDNGTTIRVIKPEQKKQKVNLFLNSLDDLTFTYTFINNFDDKEALAASMDKNRVGLLGHSLGASTIAHLAQNNKNIKALATLDLTIDLLEQSNCQRKILTPFLHIFSSQMYQDSKTGQFPYFCKNSKLSTDETVVVVENPKNKLDKLYSMHLNFVDYSTLQYDPVMAKALAKINASPNKRFLGTGNGVEITKFINKQLLDFFDRYIKVEGANAPLISEEIIKRSNN